MLKQESQAGTADQELLRLMRLRPENVDAPDRSAAEDQLPMDPPMLVNYQEEAELTFENNQHGVGSGGKPPAVPIEDHTAVVEENEFLKEQLERIKQRINDYQDMLRSFKELQDELQQREHELQERDSEIGQLNATIKGYEKRRANLEFEVHKLSKMVQESREEHQKQERELDRLADQLKLKERELIDANARYSHELDVAAEEKQAISQQFEAIKDETKKLVAKINQISLQKESKLAHEAENYRKSYEDAKDKYAQASLKCSELEEENRKLQGTIGVSRTEMERAVMSIKLQNERVQSELRLAKEREMNDQVSKLRVEIERREREVDRLETALTSKEVELKGLHEQFERSREKQQAKAERSLEELERKLVRKEQEMELLKEQLQQNEENMSRSELQNDELSSKVQSLERNVREVYEQCTQLEGKLLDQTREKAIATSELNQLKHQRQSLKDIMQHYESKVKGFGQEESMYLGEIKELKIKVQTLSDTIRLNEKTMKELNSTIGELSEKEVKQATECRELKQALLESTMNLEKSRHQVDKQGRFIDSYKLQSQKVKEHTERKWRELKRVYESQLQSMQLRLRSSEAREKSLLVQLDQADRQCKQYEFELTMSTDIKDMDYRN